MATKFHKIVGTLGYSHLMEPDTFRGATRWICDIKPDNPKAFKEIGSQLRRNDDDYFRPRRDVKKMMKGDWVEFTPPAVTNVDGSDFEGRFVPRGSKVEVTVSCYDYVFGGEKGIGTRLESVRILELAEVEAKTEIETTESTETEPETKTETNRKLPF